MATPSYPSVPVRIAREAPPVEQVHTPAWAAYQILHWGFVALPVIAGLDKFTHLLVDWTQYLAPVVAAWLPVSPRAFMQGIGVIEIIAGLLVAVRPAIGGMVVAVWLWGIIVNLLLIHL